MTTLPARTEKQIQAIEKAEAEGYEIYYEDGSATFLTDGGQADSWGRYVHRTVFIDNHGQRRMAPFQYIRERDGSINTPIHVTNSYVFSYQLKMLKAHLALIERVQAT